MKKNITLISLISLGLAALLGGCYTDTISKLETVTIQFPIFVGYDRFTRVVPDTTRQFNNLYEYLQYKENISKVESAEILDFNYRIDSMRYIDITGKEYIYDPVRNDSVFDNAAKQWLHYSNALIKFDFMRFYIHFTKGTNPSDWYPDPNEVNSKFLLGEFIDMPSDPLTVDSLYRQAKNIVPMGTDVQRVVSNAIKTRPQFYIISEFSDAKRWNADSAKWVPQHSFPYELVKFDMIIRLHVKL